MATRGMHAFGSRRRRRRRTHMHAGEKGRKGVQGSSSPPTKKEKAILREGDLEHEEREREGERGTERRNRFDLCEADCGGRVRQTKQLPLRMFELEEAGATHVNESRRRRSEHDSNRIISHTHGSF